MSWGERLKLLTALATLWTIIIFMSAGAIMSRCALCIYSMGVATGTAIAMTLKVAEYLWRRRVDEGRA